MQATAPTWKLVPASTQPEVLEERESLARIMLGAELAESEELDDDIPVDIFDNNDEASCCAYIALD